MVTAIVQAEKIGSNLSDVLVELANDTRDRRWLRAEERAARLPIKMILPMTFFMIPSLYLMIFGPGDRAARDATMTAVVVWTVLFAAAAWGGALAGEALCSDRTAFADGPRPVAFAVWLFPLAGALIGPALVLHAQSPPRLAVLAFAVFGLAGCTAADLRCGMLPDLLTLAPLALAVGAGVIARDPAPAIGAALVAPGIAALAVSPRAGGAWVGVTSSWPPLAARCSGPRMRCLPSCWRAIVAYLIARRRGRTREPIAFGPYLAGSIVATLAAASVS